MGTYLEDALESMYMLPSEIKRNFDLMRELDKVLYRPLDPPVALVALWWPTREPRCRSGLWIRGVTLAARALAWLLLL